MLKLVRSSATAQLLPFSMSRNSRNLVEIECGLVLRRYRCTPQSAQHTLRQLTWWSLPALFAPNLFLFRQRMAAGGESTPWRTA